MMKMRMRGMWESLILSRLEGKKGQSTYTLLLQRELIWQAKFSQTYLFL